MNILEAAAANRAKTPQCEQCRELGGDHEDVQQVRLYRAIDGLFIGRFSLCADHRAAEEKRGVQCRKSFERSTTKPVDWYECSGQAVDGHTARCCVLASGVGDARGQFRDARPGHAVKVTAHKVKGERDVSAT